MSSEIHQIALDLSLPFPSLFCSCINNDVPRVVSVGDREDKLHNRIKIITKTEVGKGKTMVCGSRFTWGNVVSKYCFLINMSVGFMRLVSGRCGEMWWVINSLGQISFIKRSPTSSWKSDSSWEIHKSYNFLMCLISKEAKAKPVQLYSSKGSFNSFVIKYTFILT